MTDTELKNTKDPDGNKVKDFADSKSLTDAKHLPDMEQLLNTDTTELKEVKIKVKGVLPKSNTEQEVTAEKLANAEIDEINKKKIPAVDWPGRKPETHYIYKTEKTCLMCGSSNWTNIDYLRAKPQKQIICTKCNFITFDRFSDQAHYRRFYNNNYRKQMISYSNLVTTNRKIGYHDAFIKEYLTKNKDLSICDIGAGIGYFVRYCREMGHENTHGTEYNNIMRNYAKNAYNLNLAEEFDGSKKYDLISMYHSIEHMLDPVEMLEKIKNSLNENGKLYLAIPFWLEELMDFGGGGFHSYDEYFHENHLNCWTRPQFRQFLLQSGFKIIKEETKMYGYTVLCEKCEPVKYKKFGNESFQDIVFQLNVMKRAVTAYQNQDFLDAIRLYPKFPEAYLSECGMQQKNLDVQLKILSECERVCTNTVMHHMQAGIVFYQWRRYEEAEARYREALKYRPYDDKLLVHLGILYKIVGFQKYTENREQGGKLLQNAKNIFSTALNINPSRMAEIFSEIAFIDSKLNLEDGKKSKFKQPGVKGSPEVALDKPVSGI